MSDHDARSAGVASDAPLQAARLQAAPPEVDAPLAPGAAFAPGASVDRDGPEWRELWFRASGLTIELEITGSGDHRRLAGQLIPRQSAIVDIRHGQGVITVEADTLGRFSADEVPFGQISLRCRWARSPTSPSSSPAGSASEEWVQRGPRAAMHDDVSGHAARLVRPI